eukprot:221071_1
MGNEFIHAVPSEEEYIAALRDNLKDIRSIIEKNNDKYSYNERWKNIYPQFKKQFQDIETHIVEPEEFEIDVLAKNDISKMLRELEENMSEETIKIQKERDKEEDDDDVKQEPKYEKKENTDNDSKEFLYEPRECTTEERDQEEDDDDDVKVESKYKIRKLSAVEKQKILQKYPFLQEKFGEKALDKIKQPLCIIYDYPLQLHTKSYKINSYCTQYELSAAVLHQMDILFLWYGYSPKDIKDFLNAQHEFYDIKDMRGFKKNHKEAFGDVVLWLTGNRGKANASGTCIFCKRNYDDIKHHYSGQRKCGLSCMTYDNKNEYINNYNAAKRGKMYGKQKLYFKWKLKNTETGFTLTIPNRKSQKFCESVFDATFVKPFCGDKFKPQKSIMIKNSKNEMRGITPDWFGYFKSKTEKYLLVLLYNEHKPHTTKKYIHKETQDAIDLASTKHCKVLQFSVFPWKHETESGTVINSTFEPNTTHSTNSKIKGVNIEQSNKFYGCLLKVLTDIIKNENQYGFDNLKKKGKFRDEALILYIGCDFGAIKPHKRPTDII